MRRLKELTKPKTARNYSLDGPENARAVQLGLSSAQWWQPPITKEKLITLSQRSNLRPIRDTTIWICLLVASGFLLITTWFSWWSLPLMILYGALYGGAADSRWHECGHGTAFKSPGLNTGVYYLASFLLWREPTVWKWSHYRHHSDTIIVGRDPEIAFPRPTELKEFPLVFSHLVNGLKLFQRICVHASGKIDTQVKDYVPEPEHRKVVWEARAFMFILAISVATAIWAWHPLPILIVGLPTIYGAWLFIFFGVTQHAGLQEDVLDHRLNTRTVYMNPIFRFLYSNMNYHLEHHLFPEVPYYSLPALHTELRPYLPEPSPSCLNAYNEIFTILRKQKSNPQAEITSRRIPTIAQNVSSDAICPIQINDSTSYDLGSLCDIDVGTMRRVEHEGNFHLLCRTSEREIFLTSGVCTHGNAFLNDGLLKGTTVQCPKHNGQFDVQTGKAIQKPATENLTVFNCDIIGGQITTDFSERT